MYRFIAPLFCLFLQFSAFGQDLIVTEVTGPKSYSRYEEFSATVTIKNDGIVDILNKTINNNLYLSVDSIFNIEDVKIGYTYTSGISAGASVTLSVSQSSIKVPPGNYFLIIKLDTYSSVTETNEDNNNLVIKDYVVSSPNVDWQFTSFSIDKKIISVHDFVTPAFEFKNTAPTNVGGQINLTFFLSTDSILGSNDTEIGYFYKNVFGPDVFSQHITDHLGIPKVSFGQYYIIGKVDFRAAFEETNETNNTIVGPLITVKESDIDLEIGYVHISSMEPHIINGSIEIKNNGSTRVSGFNVVPYLSTDQSWEPFDEQLSPQNFYGFIEGGKSKTLSLFNVYKTAEPGLYYLFFVIDPSRSITETNTANNIYKSPSPIYIPLPSVYSVMISDGAFIGSYDNTDTELNLSLKFTNSGTGLNTSSQNYQLTIKDANNVVQYSTTKWQSFYFYEGESMTAKWNFTMSKPLPAGQFKVDISCSNPSGCFSNNYSTTLNVDKVAYKLTGNIQGEDGAPVTKGKLFLYQKGDDRVVKFINKIVPTTGSTFTFDLDNHQHTLYFIPDPVLFPDYVPTILGKTVVLKESSFITLTKDSSVMFEILKLKPLPSGGRKITGTISAGEASGGRTHGNSVESVPVLLLSTSGEPVAIRTTNAMGYYEFNNIPPGNYQIVVAFELDQIVMKEPYDVDVTLHSATADFKVTSLGINPSFIKQQEIVFNELPVQQVGDAALTLVASASSGLPVSFTSSDPQVAYISSNQLIIAGAGTTTITATQSGNQEFSSASVTRTLTVNLVLSVEKSNDDFKAFPNPTHGLLYIDCGSLIKHAALADVTGKAQSLVYRGNVLDLTHLSPGIYLLKIDTDYESRVLRIMKE